MAVKYGSHLKPNPGAACAACAIVPPMPFVDHCHAHGWVRGALCPSCNTAMAYIDRRITPGAAISAGVPLSAFVHHYAKCKDCSPISVSSLGPTRSLRKDVPVVLEVVTKPVWRHGTLVVPKPAYTPPPPPPLSPWEGMFGVFTGVIATLAGMVGMVVYGVRLLLNSSEVAVEPQAMILPTISLICLLWLIWIFIRPESDDNG